MERARLGLVDLLRGFSPRFEILPCTCQRGGQEATLAADNKTTSVCAHAMCDPAGDRCQAVYVRTARGEAGGRWGRRGCALATGGKRTFPSAAVGRSSGTEAETPLVRVCRHACQTDLHTAGICVRTCLPKPPREYQNEKLLRGKP